MTDSRSEYSSDTSGAQLPALTDQTGRPRSRKRGSAIPAPLHMRRREGVVLRMSGRLGLGFADHSRSLLSPNRPPVSTRTEVFAKDGFTDFAGSLLDGWAVLRRHFGGLVQPVEDVPSLDVLTCRSCDGGLPAKHADGCGEGFLRGLPAGHELSCGSKLVCTVGANSFAGKGGKILCVRHDPENLGELVKEWLRLSNLKPADLAQRVREAATTAAGKTCKRQHIEQLIEAGNRLPRYIADLERAMGAEPGDLLALRMPTPCGASGVASRPPPPPRDFQDRHVVSDSDWALLQDIKDAMASPSLAKQVAQLRTELAAMKQFAESVYQRRIKEAQNHGGHD